MQGQCPRCRVRLELPTTGAYQCERCGATFQVYVPEPQVTAPEPAASTAAWAPPAAPLYGTSLPGAAPVERPLAAGVTCSNHPGNAAAHVCERCGDFMCRLCTTGVEGRWYCPRCFDLMYERGSFSFAQRQFQSPMASLLCGLGSYCACGFLAPLGIYFGVKGLQECAQRPDLPGRGLAIAGIVLSVICLLLMAIWLGLLVFGLMTL